MWADCADSENNSKRNHLYSVYLRAWNGWLYEKSSHSLTVSISDAFISVLTDDLAHDTARDYVKSRTTISGMKQEKEW